MNSIKQEHMPMIEKNIFSLYEHTEILEEHTGPKQLNVKTLSKQCEWGRQKKLQLQQIDSDGKMNFEGDWNDL
jgi:hypothetical protein